MKGPTSLADAIRIWVSLAEPSVTVKDVHVCLVVVNLVGVASAVLLQGAMPQALIGKSALYGGH